MRPRCTSSDPIGMPPSARPFFASSIAALRNSSAINGRDRTPLRAQRRMAHQVRSPREAADVIAKSGGQPQRLLLALAIRFKRARFELAHVLRSERADIVDVHQFVRHLPNV